MSFESIRAPDSTGATNPFTGFDPVLIMAKNTLIYQLRDFRDTNCRTVWTIDANPTMVRFEEAWIRYFEQDESIALTDLTYRFKFPLNSLAVEILMSSGKKRLLLYKKKQYEIFSEAMHLFGLSVDLNLIATWDRERPIVEEFVIMGLFGDIEPCESGLDPETVQKFIDEKLKSSDRRRDEVNMSSKEVHDHRHGTWNLFLEAYRYFIYNII